MNVVHLVSFSGKERELNNHLKETSNQEGSSNDIIYFLREEKAREVGVQLYVTFQRRLFSSCAERSLFFFLKKIDMTENQISAYKTSHTFLDFSSIYLWN